jgi:hypothetical protein
MAFDYERIRDEVAIPLIEEYGAAIVLSRIEDTDTYTRHYDPLTLSTYWTDSEDTRYDTKPEAVQIDYEGHGIIQNFKIEQIDGTLVQADDLRLIAIDIPQPQEGDIFTVNGIEYQYVRTDPVAPGGTTVVYNIQVRR